MNKQDQMTTSETSPILNVNREASLRKLEYLVDKATLSLNENRASKQGVISPVPYFEVRTSALNLLARIAGAESVYYRELDSMEGINPGIMTGILVAAMNDYRDGFVGEVVDVAPVPCSPVPSSPKGIWQQIMRVWSRRTLSSKAVDRNPAHDGDASRRPKEVPSDRGADECTNSSALN